MDIEQEIKKLIEYHHIEGIKSVSYDNPFLTLIIKKKLSGFLINTILTSGFSINSVSHSTTHGIIVIFRKNTIWGG